MRHEEVFHEVFHEVFQEVFHEYFHEEVFRMANVLILEIRKENSREIILINTYQ